jgi:hypothetical protein
MGEGARRLPRSLARMAGAVGRLGVWALAPRHAVSKNLRRSAYAVLLREIGLQPFIHVRKQLLKREQSEREIGRRKSGQGTNAGFSYSAAAVAR